MVPRRWKILAYTERPMAVSYGVIAAISCSAGSAVCSIEH
jgi:hypothetical protein